MTTRAAVPRGRLVTIDGDARLHPADGDPVDLVADQLCAVVVLWNQGGDSWLGWFNTMMRRWVSFSHLDLADPVIQTWIRALPKWDHGRLWHATTTPGLHLVWRRS